MKAAKRGLPPVSTQAERTISSVRAEGAGQASIGGARPGASKQVSRRDGPPTAGKKTRRKKK